MEEQEQIKDWREEISEPKDTLKIAPDSSEIFIFQDEGQPNSHQDFGNSVAFSVKIGEEEKTWYVKSNNFSLLGQIKALGPLSELKVKVNRKGSKRSDTRYKIEKVED